MEVTAAGAPGISRQDLVRARRLLAAAGCIAAPEEARELVAAAAGDPELLARLVQRRTTGEPLPWITGTLVFCGCRLTLAPGVFVPRWQSEQLAERAAELLPPDGRAVDLGTGSGAIARVLRERRPRAQVLGSELDPGAAECARGNGVEVVLGNLFEPLPAEWRGSLDLVVGALPYVPTRELDFLPRDVRAFEPLLALDGGADGLGLVRDAVLGAASWLRRGGHLVLEVGGDQPRALAVLMRGAGFHRVRVAHDPDGDPRAVESRRR